MHNQAPAEEAKMDAGGNQHFGLGQINEAQNEDISEATEMMQGNGEAIQYAPAQEAIGTQLEMMS